LQKFEIFWVCAT